MINPDEMLFVVDEDNNPVEPLPRSVVHAKGLWHRTSHIWVRNSHKLILCQRRSIMKDSSPGMWEGFFGGHVAAGGDYLDSAKMELEEELGIKADKAGFKNFGIFKSERGIEFQGIYGLLWDGNIKDLKLEEEEVEEVAWFEISDLREIFRREDDDWATLGSELEVIKWLENLE